MFEKFIQRVTGTPKVNVERAINQGFNGKEVFDDFSGSPTEAYAKYFELDLDAHNPDRVRATAQKMGDAIKTEVGKGNIRPEQIDALVRDLYNAAKPGGKDHPISVMLRALAESIQRPVPGLS